MTRIAELTAKLLDGSLSDAEWKELDALISEPNAEAEHLSLLQLEAELRGLRTDFDLVNATLAKVAEAQAERTAKAVLDQIATAPLPTWSPHAAEVAPPPQTQLQAHQSRSHRVLRLAVGVFAACAAALLVAISLNGLNSPLPIHQIDPESTAFAKLSSRAGSVEVLSPTGETIPAVEGSELPAGFTLRTIGDESLAVVELLNDKTRVEIEPDSVVRFAGNSADSAGKPSVFLAAGQLTADVPQRPGDRPLIIATAVAELLTREGIFVLSSTGPDSTRVDIKHGKVDLVRAATPKPVRLAAGGTAVVFAGVDRLDIEHAQIVDRTPKRTLTFPGVRDVAFSGSEVLIANARAFARWPAVGNPVEMSFYPRGKANDGVAAITRNKKFLVTLRGSLEDRVLIRTLPDGGEHAAINIRLNEPRYWTVSPDAAWLAVVDPKPNNKCVRVFDGRSGEERFMREFDDAISCIAATPDGRNLAVGVHSTARGVGNKIVFLDAFTSDRLFALSVLKRPLLAMAFSPNNRYLAAGYNGTVQLWDLRTLELVRTINGFERALACLAFSPDGKQLAAGTQDGYVWLWDADTGRQTQLIDVGNRGIRAIAFNANGKQLVTASNNGSVAVWDVVDRLPLDPNIQ